MIVAGLLGLVSTMGFVSWVTFRDPWVRSHGDPVGPNAQRHAEHLRGRRRLATRRALDRLRDTRDRSDAVASSDYFREANAQGAGHTVNPGIDCFSHLQRS
jgi:hypothetical protein